MKSVRIGNGCGFWGDNLDAPILLARAGRLDFLTLEYLAELTMSILALQKRRNPEAGFATDFLDVLARLVPVLHEQQRLRIITNAGGMNPSACARQARNLLDEAGLGHLRVAWVDGDDLLPRFKELLDAGHRFEHLEKGTPLEPSEYDIVSANAYLGAMGITRALDDGAAVVITGRVADASLTVGPAVHAFGWSWDDWDRLAAATVAGHLIECGAQATGGLWCHWEEAPDLADVGYPLVELDASGRFTLTKPEGTGGTVNFETASAQLLYEVGDPTRYLTPDVVADFTTVTLREVGPNEVEVTGARGRPAPDRLKVSAAYRAGFQATGSLVIFGRDAVAKAEVCGRLIRERLDRAGVRLDEFHVERLGAGDTVPGVFPRPEGLMEVVLRVTARAKERAAVERFTRELAPLVTSGPPGVTGYTGGRPPVRELLGYWPSLIDRSLLSPEVHFIG